MFPNELTTYVGRASDAPSNTGSLIYNTLYRELGTNALYLQLVPTSSEALIAGLRGLRFRGCTVVGSHAKGVLPYLDGLDANATNAAAVNTLVVDDGKIIGHKTDGPALIDAIREKTPLENRDIVILGAGKLVRELLFLLPEQHVRSVAVYNRTESKARALSDAAGCTFGGGLEQVLSAKGDILINATDIGSLWSDTKAFFTDACVDRFETIVDVTFKPLDTPLQEVARRHNKQLVEGARFFSHQGKRQVMLYLGLEPAIDRIVELVHQEFGDAAR